MNRYQIFPTRSNEYTREIREYTDQSNYRVVATDLTIAAARELVYCAEHSTERTLVQVEISPDGDKVSSWICPDCVTEIAADMLAA